MRISASVKALAIDYDLDIPSLFKKLRAVSLLSFEEGLISKLSFRI